MSHSLTRIWIHAIFGTKEWEPLIVATYEQQLHAHIREHLERDFDCPIRAINGIANHMHMLFLLNPNHAVKDILKNIKGESSHWVNEQDFLRGKFAWQTGYGAFSVSESNVAVVEAYIRNQKEHHRKKTFKEEYREFLALHGLPLQETFETVSSSRSHEYSHD